jgi:hypothetical protein
VHHQSAATRDAGACECPSEDPQTERTNRRRHARRCVLTDIANIIAFDAIDAGGGFEWNMFCELVTVGRVRPHLPPQ